MSKERMSEFFQYGPQLDITPVEGMILLELSRRESDQGLCCPGIMTLAKFVHASRRTVIESIKYLKEMKILQVTKYEGNRTHNSYKIDMKNRTHVKHPQRPQKKEKVQNPHQSGEDAESAPIEGKYKGADVAPIDGYAEGAESAPLPTNRKVQNPHPINYGVLGEGNNNPIKPKPSLPPNPIKPHSPRAHAKDVTGFGGGGVGQGALTNGLRKTGGIPKLSPLDTDGMPKGYPKEDEYLAFIESLLTDKGRKLWRSIRIEGQKNYRTICDRGWLDGQGRFISNWKQYARSCIAKAFETQPPTILKWDESLIVVTGMVPPPVIGLKPCIRPSKPAEQPQKPLPPPTEERKPDPKPEQPPMEIPAVEPQPPSKPHVSPFDADPVLAQQLKVHQMIRERKEAERRRLMGLPV